MGPRRTHCIGAGPQKSQSLVEEKKTSPPHKAEGQFRPRLVNKMGRETEEQFLPGQEQEALREVRGSQPDNAGMSDPRGPPGTSCVLTQSL